MPSIVIGGDTRLGRAIAIRLIAAGGEVRAFVSDADIAATLRGLGIKVALGDVSDDSHVGGAAVGCFSAIVVPEAAFDDRERAFADSPADVVSSWVEALREAAVTRVIWLDDDRLPDGPEPFRGVVAEVATVVAAGLRSEEVAVVVAHVDDMRSLDDV